MEEVLNIFRIVKCGRCTRGLGGLLFVSWFSRIDTFPDAEFSEIGQADLEFSNGLSSRNKVLGLASYSFLLDLSHLGNYGDCFLKWYCMFRLVGFKIKKKFRQLNFFWNFLSFHRLCPAP